MGLDPFCYHIKTNPRKEEWAVINLYVRINNLNTKNIWEIVTISRSPIMVSVFLYVVYFQ